MYVKPLSNKNNKCENFCDFLKDFAPALYIPKLNSKSSSTGCGRKIAQTSNKKVA
jgi:hypothetical protein